MILIALGGNLPHPTYGPVEKTLNEALRRLAGAGCRVLALSPWYRTKPVPPSGQPDYTNGAALLETDLDPVALLALLHRTEADLGRVRGAPNAARTIDLDLLAHGRLIRPEGGPPPTLPHPRMAERRFVLQPLCDIAPDWRHPGSGLTARQLLAQLPSETAAERRIPG